MSQIIKISSSGSSSSTEFPDNTFRIFDDGDNTKEVAFEVSGVTTGTTRTLTIPDASGTVALIEDFIDSVFRIYDDGDVTKELAFEVSAINPSTTRTITVPDQNINLTPDSTFQQTISGATISSATVATGDKVLIQDVDDLDNLKYVTAQSIADLGGGGGVTSVSGTASRVSSTGGATPIIDIDAAYVGQGSITTLGTITTGVWTGTDVAVSDGGTGLSSTTAYAVLCGGTTSTSALQSIASVGTSGQILTSNGAGALPTFQAAGGGGGGDVSGGGTSTDNALVRWNGVSGDTIQDSNYLFDDAPAGYAGSESHSVKDVVQTTDATITDLVQIAIVEDRVLAIESRIAVIQSDHTTFDTFFIQCAFKREAGGNVAIIGTPIVNSMDGSILTITVTADTVAQEGTIQVTGVAATTYNWVSHTNYHFVNTNA